MSNVTKLHKKPRLVAVTDPIEIRQFLSQATAEIEEWKRRFDLLLARTPASTSKAEGA